MGAQKRKWVVIDPPLERFRGLNAEDSVPERRVQTDDFEDQALHRKIAGTKPFHGSGAERNEISAGFKPSGRVFTDPLPELRSLARLAVPSPCRLRSEDNVVAVTERGLHRPTLQAADEHPVVEPANCRGIYPAFGLDGRAVAEVPGSGPEVLAQYRGPADPETGGSFTVKRYSSEKRRDDDGGWRHASVTLAPTNSEFEAIALTGSDAEAVRVVAELVAVLHSTR